VRDALIVPVAPGPELANGVFRPDGSFCDFSRTRISDDRFTDPPLRPDRAQADRLKGRYLFAGIGRHHFGHFLMETASRLWALDGRQDLYDGLVILPMPKINLAAVLRRRMMLFFDLMGCNMPLHLISRPMIAEQLDLPAQGFGHAQWAVGHEEFRRFVRHRIARTCAPIGPDKLYVSRRKLSHRFQRLDQEKRIEALMKQAGYTVFHPERHDMQAQCKAYAAAQVIVGGDGSAFHLMPFAVQPDTRIGLIQRRARLAPVDAIADQINAFARVDLVRLNPLRTPPNDSKIESTGRTDAQPISFRRLKKQLEEANLI
jgi:capsular polysaccharide biosynthesis protein